MKHEYYLIAHIPAKSFSKYRGDAVRILEQIPKTVEEVLVGKKKCPEKMRRITTFRDENGNIIERAFDFSDGKLRNRVYTRRTLDINDNEKVNSTIIHDYYINKRVLPFYKAMMEDYAEANPAANMLWNLIEVVTNHVSKVKNTGEKILSQVKISNIQTQTKRRHTFIEFPQITDGKISNAPKKFLTFLVNRKTNTIAKNSIRAQGVKIPVNDDWLSFRAYTVKDSKEPFADKFIREKNLQKALIEIDADYFPKNEDEKLYAADFNPANGSINFNRLFKPYSKTRAVGIAKHEAEHGWQYFLRSRFTEPTTDWEEFIYRTFGKIKSKKLRKEAERYAKSIEKYVILTKELEDAGKVDEYRENYIEKMAQKAAKKVRLDYDKKGKVIRKDFPHIPREYL